jgi:hypothetical protein
MPSEKAKAAQLLPVYELPAAAFLASALRPCGVSE